jgi:hypothetical protein
MGLCKGDTTTAVPTRILVVRAAIWVARIREEDAML